MTARRKVERGAMRVRAYPVLIEAVERGVEAGWRRAHKHADHPDESLVREQIYQSVVGEICEAFDFPEDC